MSKSMDLKQFKQFRDNMAKLEKDVPEFLEEFILKMAYRALAQTKKLTPVDTGELRNKWEVMDVKVHKYVVEASIFNPQEYASHVENGHWQRRRWLPGVWVSGGRRGRKFKYVKGADTGIMLTERWVPGHYMARISINKIEQEIPQRLQRELHAWMRRKLGA